MKHSTNWIMATSNVNSYLRDVINLKNSLRLLCSLNSLDPGHFLCFKYQLCLLCPLCFKYTETKIDWSLDLII